MCAYGHIHVQRIQNQPAIIDLSCWWMTLAVVAEHGRFCSRYNNYTCMLLAFTRGSHLELWHCTQWQSCRHQALGIWKPISQFRILFWSTLPVPLCSNIIASKAMCNITNIVRCIIICCKKFRVFNFRGWCQPWGYF